jgi:hypothetical protein
MKRLCFLSPDVEHIRKVVADLKNNGVPEKNIYVVARHDIELEDMPDAGPEADDFIVGYKRGLGMGGTAGLLAGLTALAFPPAGLAVGGGLVALLTGYGAGVGALLTSLAGAAFPSTRLKEFRDAIDEGQILVMVDVPKREVTMFETLIKALDPAVSVEGIEPSAEIIP